MGAAVGVTPTRCPFVIAGIDLLQRIYFIAGRSFLPRFGFGTGSNHHVGAAVLRGTLLEFLIIFHRLQRIRAGR